MKLKIKEVDNLILDKRESERADIPATPQPLYNKISYSPNQPTEIRSLEYFYSISDQHNVDEFSNHCSLQLTFKVWLKWPSDF